MTHDLILGTAGHIDHGKTSLIRALTGTDTDRLPEEKKRGITIELGFAQLQVGDFRLGIVDVPGHERFVRNMLAGATGMDLVMLVVAADDSIKPQTVEHLDILRLLNRQAGVIALTKCDLAEPDWLELVEDEIRELVHGSFLENAAIIRTSSATGLGLDDLRGALHTAAQASVNLNSGTSRSNVFRLAIDRCFTVAGHGTVVTGSVGSGAVAVGDELELQPAGVRVRVRSIQNHSSMVDSVHRGQRAAINLGGIHHQDVLRGFELATPGRLMPSRCSPVKMTVLPAARKPLKHRSRVRLHLGTTELIASVLLLNQPQLDPGNSGYAQVLLNEPAVATWNQPCVVRSESPFVTIGGGHVLLARAARLRRPTAVDLRRIQELGAADVVKRAGAAAYFQNISAWSPADLWQAVDAAEPLAIVSQLVDAGTLKRFEISSTRTIHVHEDVLQRLYGQVESVLEHLHDAEPLRGYLDRSRLSDRFKHLEFPQVLAFALSTMSTMGRVRLTKSGVGLRDRGPQLSQNEQKLLTQLVDTLQTAGIEAPTAKELQQAATKNKDSVPQLLSLAAANGDLVQITDEYYLHADVEQQIRQTLAEKMAGGSGKTMSEIRETLGTSRKYAVPLCEHFDRSGFTVRQGDLRVLGRP